MKKWNNISLSKEEEEGVTVVVDEVSGKENFPRSLAGKLWTDNSFNAKVFTSTMISSWKLKNPVETQKLRKNLFLFCFTTKYPENVWRNALWSFDRNLLVLTCFSDEEQPSDLNMYIGVFWVKIYELPLMLKSEMMARKIRGIL